ncbi:prepilin peptidase [Vibrio tapetis]|uniref:prepilin peptidase n=1 Tax=Vibrio tapetis TaxID=52443 RepID=UPI00338EE1BC
MLFAIVILIICARICYTDIKFRKIENWVLTFFLAVICISSIFKLGVQVSVYQVLYGLAFSIFGMFFLHRVIGSGDIKLISIFLFVINTNYYHLFFLLSLFFGGALAIVYVALNICIGKSNTEGIPYGIPISISGYFLLLASL